MPTKVLIALALTLALAAVRLDGIPLPGWVIALPTLLLAVYWALLGVFLVGLARGRRRGQQETWAHVRRLLAQGVMECRVSYPVVPKPETNP